jgi:hypothetical protein
LRTFGDAFSAEPFELKKLLDDNPQTCPRGITARRTKPFGPSSPKVGKSQAWVRS